jgi:hypothetical protein
MTRDYAERRARWEPLMEVTQMKGDSEAHPLLSPEDEFADFETWDRVNIAGEPKTEDMLQYEYARSALKIGIRLEETLGVNPFKFGMIGSSDTHTSMSTTREENYFGKLPHLEPNAKRAEEPFMSNPETGEVMITSWEASASGLAAVWARENTRESIFDAMARKEVYATSGGRMTVRVFAGWDFQPDEVERPDFAAQGYARGVTGSLDKTARLWDLEGNELAVIRGNGLVTAAAFSPSVPSQPLMICTRSRLAPSGSRRARTMKVGAAPEGALESSPPIGTPRP